MKLFRKKILVVFISLLGYEASAQTTIPNTSCEHPYFACINPNMVPTDFPYDFRIPTTSTCQFTTPFDLWYTYNLASSVSASGLFIQSSTALGMQGYTLYGPFFAPLAACDIPGLGAGVILSSSSTPATTYTTATMTLGYYYLKIPTTVCNQTITLSKVSGGTFGCNSAVTCDKCIGSFAPEASKEYVLSAWVKEDAAAATKTSYNFPSITIDFVPAASVGPYTASGQIIDGWQRIEQKFTIPVGSTQMTLKMACSTGTCYFDDVRVFPNDGSMKSYVYDPVNLRLVAEMDERHYATMYEYDEEGKLVRIKKETERGIMTIQESKTAVVKQ